MVSQKTPTDSWSVVQRVKEGLWVSNSHLLSQEKRAFLRVALIGYDALEWRIALENIPGIEHLSRKSILNFLYLIGMYWFKDESIPRPQIIKEADLEGIYNLISKQLQAEGVGKEEIVILIEMIQKYVWSIVMQDAVAKQYEMMWTGDVTQMKPILYSPASYQANMEWVYRLFQRVEDEAETETLPLTIDSLSNKTSRDNVCYQYPQEFSMLIAELSKKICEITSRIWLSCIEFGPDEVHTSLVHNQWVKVDGKHSDTYAPNMTEFTPWLIAYALTDITAQGAPKFKNLWIMIKWDSVILATQPLWTSHLKNIVTGLRVLPNRRWTWGSHITIAKFAWKTSDPDTIRDIIALLKKYSKIIQDRYPIVEPDNIFIGTAIMNFVEANQQETFIKYNILWRKYFS